ncbi:MAG: Flp family type IVb pilin [SAR324 cluster bacterium]|uniref:Flp family type IVb pilin n=1 Tax=SAR324 cluster bacterium TaxID=2024889 RepID=A0A7X9FRK2_9DELT|nr:Flp family type IVb pilin [SAR324 cluster bacterium]
MLKVVRNPFKKAEKGASLVEYALLVALIAVACIVAIRALGQRVSAQFSTITSALS